MGVEYSKQMQERQAKEDEYLRQRWKLCVPVVCFEFRSYNYDRTQVQTSQYWTDGVNTFWYDRVSPETVCKSDSLVRSYPSSNSWRLGPNGTEGFAGVLQMIKRRLQTLETIADLTQIDPHIVKIIESFDDPIIQSIFLSCYTGGN